ncbi:hypothetical protein [Photobacterium sp. GSS17]|uniref:hypothetical protein n=1 Tax=Photobacterium sp. GSS17 TaxID=3020715 RepID=UPI00235F4128|nr:hypothetical protein [Photobacterium sp. GSS17]
MISFVFFQILIVIFIVFNARKKIDGVFIVSSVFIFSGLVFLFQIYEFKTFDTLLYKTDEQTYIDLASREITDIGRSLWIIINKYFYYWEPTASVYLLKLINIPVLMLLTYYIYMLLGSNIKTVCIVLFVPYLFIMSVSNLRDLSILLSITMFFFYFKEKRYLLSLISWMLILFLRPLIAVVAIFSLIFVLFVITKQSIRVKSALASLAIVFLGIAYFLLGEYVSSYFNYYSYLYENSGDIDARGVVANGLNITSIIYAFLTYVFTPMPHSLLERVMSGGSEIWGMTDDIFRLINQTFYYFMLVILVGFAFSRPVKFFNGLKSMSIALKSYILTLVLYAPIYTIHLSGITHQRLKVPFQIAVAILFMIAVLKWLENNEENKI